MFLPVAAHPGSLRQNPESRKMVVYVMMILRQITIEVIL